MANPGYVQFSANQFLDTGPPDFTSSSSRGSGHTTSHTELMQDVPFSLQQQMQTIDTDTADQMGRPPRTGLHHSPSQEDRTGCE